MPAGVVKDNHPLEHTAIVAHLLPFALLFASGFCALVYQVAWTRALGLAFGHTVYAVAAVVTAFMAGLALGARLAARRVDRHRTPAALYGWLEIGIAATALLFPLVPPAVSLVLSWIWKAIGTQATLFNVVRVVIAFVALLPPCILMGATLPAAAAWVSRRATGGDGASAARLYAVNTIGATLGCLCAGFVLIEQLGMLGTQLSAVAANVAIGAVAIAAGRRALVATLPGNVQPAPAPAAPRARKAATAAPPDDLPASLPMVVAASGLVALVNEIAWTRALIFVNGTTTYAFSSLLTVYLASVAGGSLFAAAIDVPRAWLASLLRWSLILGALATAASLQAAASFAPVADRLWPPQASWAALVTGNLAKAAVTVALPTCLLSMVLPLAIRLERSITGIGERVGRLYALNTLGGIAGAAISGFLAIPWLGVHRTILLGALLVAVCAVALRQRTRRAPITATAAAATVVALALLIGGTSASARLAGPLHRVEGSEGLLYYAEGSGATVSVVREVAGTKTIYIDGVPVAGTDPVMLTDQKSLAHVPMLLHRGARDVLTVGFGSGGASWSFSRYPELRSIDCVEIDRSVVAAAPWLTESNHEVWNDARFRVILDDARSYLGYSDKQYDIISTDCTDLRYKSNASLYTTDYFTLCRRRLRPSGLVVVWMPLGGLSDGMLKLAMRTFRSVFPHATLWYLHNLPTHYALLVGSMEPQRIDVGRVLGRMARHDVRTDLAEIFLDAPEKVLNGLLLDEAAYAQFAGDGNLNTDDEPILEFRAPREAYQFALSRNLNALASRRSAVVPMLDWSGHPGEAGLRARLAETDAAVPAILAGHAAYQRQTFEYAEALREYERAGRLDPRDTTVPRLIDLTRRTRELWMRELELRTREASPAAADFAALGVLYAEQDRAREAIPLLERALALQPGLHAARRQLAGARARLGETDEAVRLYRDAIARDPSSAEAHNDLGLLLLERGEVPEAREHFETATRLDAGSAAAWHNLGLSLVRTRDAAGAERAYLRALAIDGRMVEAIGNLAALYLTQDRRGEAVPLIARLRAVDPDSAAAAVLEQRASLRP